MLAEADMGMTSMAMGEGARTNGDEQLLVKFYIHPKQSAAKTAEAGRPIFEDREYIRIIQPGNKDSIIERPASDMDRQRFSAHYQKFKSRSTEEDYVEGTLLEHWPGVTRSQVEELRYLNIRTVEHLATMSDSNSQGFMGLNLLKRKAQEYLDASVNQAHATEMATLREQNETMMAELARLRDEMNAAKASDHDAIDDDDEQPAPKRRARRKAA